MLLKFSFAFISSIRNESGKKIATDYSICLVDQKIHLNYAVFFANTFKDLGAICFCFLELFFDDSFG